MIEERHDRLRKARVQAGFAGPAEAAERFGWNENTYKSNENGNAPFSFNKAKIYADAFKVSATWLYAGEGPMSTGSDQQFMVPVIGRVAANAEGSVIMEHADRPTDVVPAPPGGTPRAAALLVVGHSMHGVADEGSLLYFEAQHTPPTPEMFGKVVIVETEDGEVLVKRLLRGSKKGLFDLESLVGGTRHDIRLRWAALITAIILPHQARLIIRPAEAA